MTRNGEEARHISPAPALQVCRESEMDYDCSFSPGPVTFHSRLTVLKQVSHHSHCGGTGRRNSSTFYFTKPRPSKKRNLSQTTQLSTILPS